MSFDTNTISILACGFGNWAITRTLGPILENPFNGARLVGTCQRLSSNSPENSHPEVLEILRRVPFFPTLQEALECLKGTEKPNAVVINTPNALHFNDAMEAINAGCHVYVERPIVVPQDDFHQLLKAAKEHDVILFTGVQRRLEEPFRYIHDAVSAHNGFGEIRSIRCTLAVGDSPRGWRTDAKLACGGILLDNGYHLLDQAIWILEGSNIDLTCIENTTVQLSDFIGEAFGIEQTAIGMTHIGGVHLVFDFTYKAPKNSVFERLDVRDDEGGQISLMRNLPQRSPQPGLIRHMRGDGTTVNAELCCGLGFVSVRVQDVALDSEAMNTGPLLSFFSAIRTREKGHVCEANASVMTWKLIRHLYERANSIINT